MGSLPSVYRFDPGDYQGLGSTFQKFLGNLNLFTWNVYNNLNGGLGFSNLQRALYTRTVTATSNTSFSFTNPLPVAPSGLALVKVVVSTSQNTAITSAVSVANWTYDGTNIKILSIPGLTAGTSYTLTIEVM